MDKEDENHFRWIIEMHNKDNQTSNLKNLL